MHQEAFNDRFSLALEYPSLYVVPGPGLTETLPEPLDVVSYLAKKKVVPRSSMLTIVETPEGPKVVQLSTANYQAASLDYSAPNAQLLAKARKDKGRLQKQNAQLASGGETTNKVISQTNMFFQISATKDGENVASASIGAHVSKPLRDEFVNFVAEALLGDNAHIERFGKKSLIYIEVDEHDFRYSPDRILHQLTEVPRQASNRLCSSGVHRIQSKHLDDLKAELRGAKGQEYAGMLNGQINHLIPAMREGETFVFNYRYQYDEKHNRFDFMAANADDLPQGMLDLAVNAPDSDTAQLLLMKRELLKSVSKGKLMLVAEACGDDWADFCCGDAVNAQRAEALQKLAYRHNEVVPGIGLFSISLEGISQEYCNKCKEKIVAKKCRCNGSVEGSENYDN